MRSVISLLVAALSAVASPVSYTVVGDEPGSWPAILEPAGFRNGPAARLLILRAGADSAVDWEAKAASGAWIVLEGESAVAESFGFSASKRRVLVRSVLDARAPRVSIVWQHQLELPVHDVPAGARVFVRERWTGAPLLAGMRTGAGAVLWMAASPGERGYERFPYLPHALADLGLETGVRSQRLWAFFDSSYRLRVDPEYFARRWREAGIAALHVAAWQYNEPDAARDKWLADLIAACHRNAILVYAWIELPHVSERFWQDHPEWREKTAALQDAHLDWRRLMNLQNADCRAAVLRDTQALLRRFDWDGVNLGELYFESLEGAANPARFTPFNDDVRRMYREQHGADPVELMRRGDGAELRPFLEFRAALTRDMQEFWTGALDAFRRAERPGMDLVLTHIDDRFDERMRDSLGADAAAVLPMLDRRDFTFLIEDPATVWHLGPERYPEIAARYGELTSRRDRLAIDINIVERYQDVYPTKQQTGTELLQLVHIAAGSFERVALYFENSIHPSDVRLLSAAGAVLDRYDEAAGKLVVSSRRGAGVPWTGGALVDGRLWPVLDGGTVWLPGGSHTVESTVLQPPLRILAFNGDLHSATAADGAVEISYESGSRALALLDTTPASVEIDGEAVVTDLLPGNVLRLPRGQHIVTIRAQASMSSITAPDTPVSRASRP